jgi:hypothetical protein
MVQTIPKREQFVPLQTCPIVPAPIIDCPSWGEFWSQPVGNSFKLGLLNTDKTLSTKRKDVLSSLYRRI